MGETRIGPNLCPSPKTNLNKGQKSLVKDVLTKLPNLLRILLPLVKALALYPSGSPIGLVGCKLIFLYGQARVWGTGMNDNVERPKLLSCDHGALNMEATESGLRIAAAKMLNPTYSSYGSDVIKRKIF